MISPSAKRYAMALFGAAEAVKATGQVARDLEELRKKLEEPGLARATLAPDVPERLRRAALEPVAAGLHALVQGVVRTAITRRRTEILPQLDEAFEELRRAARGELHGVVETARPLQPDQLTAVEEAAGRMFGKTVKLVVKEVPALLGGLRIRIGNTLWDGSIATQLSELERQLLEAPLA
jgi:F-type H+-transporting ATPase subunit delta